MTNGEDHDALHLRIEELERGLEEARAEAAAGKEAKAEVERLRESFAQAQHELEELRRKLGPQEAGRRVSLFVACIAGIVGFVAGAAVSLVVSSTRPAPPQPASVAAQVPPMWSQQSPASRPGEESPEERLALDVLRQHGAEVRGCYLKELKANPSLEGKVQLVLSIDDGRVMAAIGDGSTLNNANVEACLVEVARRWRVPFRGRFSYRFPLVFRTSE